MMSESIDFSFFSLPSEKLLLANLFRKKHQQQQTKQNCACYLAFLTFVTCFYQLESVKVTEYRVSNVKFCICTFAKWFWINMRILLKKVEASNTRVSVQIQSRCLIDGTRGNFEDLRRIYRYTCYFKWRHKTLRSFLLTRTRTLRSLQIC